MDNSASEDLEKLRLEYERIVNGFANLGNMESESEDIIKLFNLLEKDVYTCSEMLMIVNALHQMHEELEPLIDKYIIKGYKVGDLIKCKDENHMLDEATRLIKLGVCVKPFVGHKKGYWLIVESVGVKLR